MDIDDYQITKYYTSAGYYYMMKQLFHNPYFPIFDFTLTNTKTNLSAKKKIQIVYLSTNKNTTFS